MIEIKKNDKKDNLSKTENDRNASGTERFPRLSLRSIEMDVMIKKFAWILRIQMKLPDIEDIIFEDIFSVKRGDEKITVREIRSWVSWK